MAKPVIAIVGRPNVGKSTLFNKLIDKRLSIVDDTPGVTRDRVEGEAEWQNHKMLLIDTGGIEEDMGDIMLKKMRDQAFLAIDTADVIVFLTDLKTGPVATDFEIAEMLKKSGKPVILAVNKCDSIGETDPGFYEFYNLGLGDPIAVSSVHGHGTGDLLEKICEYIQFDDSSLSEDDRITVAIIGKPNAGKSSLLNKIAGKERAIVSDIAGTTRDSIDINVENNGKHYTFIDTAGLRRKSKVEEKIEKYSNIRVDLAVDRADVCVILIDGTEGFTEQDSKVASKALDAGKACIIAVNKWDIVEKDGGTMDKYRKKLMQDFSFMSYAPIIFLSAKTGQRIDRLFSLIDFVYSQSTLRISTGMLNDLLADAIARVQPPSDRGKRLKIYYMTQISVKPPTFVIFCNKEELFHFSYQRYIENQIRSTFGMEGTPIKFIIRERQSNK